MPCKLPEVTVAELIAALPTRSDGGVLLGQLELQKGLQDQFLQAYRKSVLSAFSNVEQALIAVQQTTEAERIQSNVVKTSRRAFDLSEQQLKAGTLNLVTLLQTEQTLFTAEDLLSVDRFNRLFAAVSLFQALGGGWLGANQAGLPNG